MKKLFVVSILAISLLTVVFAQALAWEDQIDGSDPTPPPKPTYYKHPSTCLVTVVTPTSSYSYTAPAIYCYTPGVDDCEEECDGKKI